MARQTVLKRESLGAWRSNPACRYSSTALGASQPVGSAGWYLETGLKPQSRGTGSSSTRALVSPPRNGATGFPCGVLDLHHQSGFLSQVSESRVGSSQPSMKHVCPHLLPKRFAILPALAHFLGRRSKCSCKLSSTIERRDPSILV